MQTGFPVNQLERHEENPTAPDRVDIAVDAPVIQSRSTLPLLLAVWVAGGRCVAGFTARRWLACLRSIHVRGRLAIRKLEAAARELESQLQLNHPTEVIISQDNRGPCVLGLWRPTLVMPKSLVEAKTVNQLRPVLAHELLHARRGDTLFAAIQFLAQMVWWFHPAVRWANRQADRICEQCCDEEVVANLQCKPNVYTGCLLDTLEIRTQLALAPGIAGIRPGDITSKRLENIMSGAHQFHATTPRLDYALAAFVS